MLKLLRSKHIAKFIFWSLVVLILPAFVLWGTGSLSGPKSKLPKYVGTVDGKKISFETFSENLQAIRTQVFLNYFPQPQLVNSLLKNKALVAKMAWDRLLMLREAEKAGMKASDADVIKLIRGHPLFTRKGSFDDRLYAYILRNNIGLDARRFEEMVRENIKIQRLNDQLVKDIAVTDDEALAEYKNDYGKFRISYVFVETEKFVADVKIDDRAAREYYDTHKDEFTVPAAPDDPDAKPRTAEFDGVKESIRSYLAGREAVAIASKYAEEAYRKITDLVEKDGMKFKEAAKKAGMKVEESQLFSKGDYLEGLGEAAPIVEEAARMAAGGVSLPMQLRKGFLIFAVAESLGADEAAF
jgi:hypothetical protein